MDYTNYQICFGFVADVDNLSTSYEFCHIWAGEYIDHAVRWYVEGNKLAFVRWVACLHVFGIGKTETRKYNKLDFMERCLLVPCDVFVCISVAHPSCRRIRATGHTPWLIHGFVAEPQRPSWRVPSLYIAELPWPE